ncbi:hypothetical protein SAMN05421682_10241 [Chryseobacterium indoltheticum]|uniref:Uncharacterized protein n=1 Tax=Chryseobacterium indoltheticum TaxID=254 RepID=A0A381FG56_9FLAO|nr:hypothetical protein SAMN05421682_10241 [Chryseobacterium indoltheticum]SUX45142.1 Uncharacterised protein [Chryseobacterium indoltheticum]
MMKKIVAYFYVSIFTKIDITIIKGYGSNHRCIFFILLFYTALRSIVLHVHLCLAGIKIAPSILQTFYMNIYSLQTRQKNKSCCVQKKRNAKSSDGFFLKIKNIVTALLAIAGK